MHWPDDMPEDYFEQLLGEIKAPHRTIKNRLTWQQKAGQAVEDLDCEVYALHAARFMRVHVKSDADWFKIEQSFRQAELFTQPVEPALAPPSTVKKPKRRNTFGGV